MPLGALERYVPSSWVSSVDTLAAISLWFHLWLPSLCGPSTHWQDQCCTFTNRKSLCSSAPLSAHPIIFTVLTELTLSFLHALLISSSCNLLPYYISLPNRAHFVFWLDTNLYKLKKAKCKNDEFKSSCIVTFRGIQSNVFVLHFIFPLWYAIASMSLETSFKCPSPQSHMLLDIFILHRTGIIIL